MLNDDVTNSVTGEGHVIKDKAPYVAKSDKRRKESEKSIAAYNKNQDVGRKGEEEAEDFDRSKLEVNDEEHESESKGVQVLSVGTMETRKNAAATFFSLSLANENKIMIGASDAILT
ncbi:zinc finger, RING/FYVE/PHD-type, Armadillo-type fold protein [Artemisia annua]|uniref:Zinc finger, RING/FYVE/PHD-type, Armadillo-type fold protein n=1 Tax=Artemisia annua TaxID=35608 RepID=A0A2U1PN86_ARTAN|nr:zinc finger, RING/FYVE/PHD-type, Armadillo-type fold protein [Artemisia annua]